MGPLTKFLEFPRIFIGVMCETNTRFDNQMATYY